MLLGLRLLCQERGGSGEAALDRCREAFVGGGVSHGGDCQSGGPDRGVGRWTDDDHCNPRIEPPSERTKVSTAEGDANVMASRPCVEDGLQALRDALRDDRPVGHHDFDRSPRAPAKLRPVPPASDRRRETASRGLVTSIRESAWARPSEPKASVAWAVIARPGKRARMTSVVAGPAEASAHRRRQAPARAYRIRERVNGVRAGQQHPVVAAERTERVIETARVPGRRDPHHRDLDHLGSARCADARPARRTVPGSS